MLNAGSQIFLDNAAPKSTDSLSSSKPSSADDGSFNDIFENANKEIESKNNSNNTNNNSHSSSKDSEKKANESQASHKNTVKSDKTSKPKSSEHTQKTKSDDSAEQAKSSDKAKESAASEKTQAKTSKPDDSDADAAAELEQETQQFIKSNTLNTLSLSQVEKTDETEVDELTDTNVDEKPEKNIHALIARMLNSRNQGKQELDADQKAEAVRQNTLAQLNVPQEKTSEFVKSVVAELRSKSDFNNHIQKQASVAQQDALAKAEVDPMKAALAIDEDMELDDQKVDEFVSQVFERLNMNKSNLEAIIAAKAGNDKIEMQNQIMDQVAQKQSLENVSPLSLASTGVNQKPANNLAPTQQFTMNTHINQPEWGSEFGKRIQFMIKNNVQTAELRLDPPELGRINVKINFSNDHAHVSFSSAHQSVRDTIEQTMPRLRELLAESGLQLGNADVTPQFQQQAREQTGSNDGNLFGPATPDFDEELEMDTSQPAKVHYASDGMIDYFA